MTEVKVKEMYSDIEGDVMTVVDSFADGLGVEVCWVVSGLVELKVEVIPVLDECSLVEEGVEEEEKVDFVKILVGDELSVEVVVEGLEVLVDAVGVEEEAEVVAVEESVIGINPKIKRRSCFTKRYLN